MNYIEGIQRIRKKDISGLLLVYGNEAYLLDLFIKELRENYIDPSYEEFNYTKFDFEDIEFSKLEEAAETLPFFSEKRLVEVRGLDLSKEGISKNKEFFDSLQKYLESMSKETILVLVAKSEKFFKGSFYKSCQKTAIIVEMTRFNRQELTNFLANKLGERKIRIRKKDMDYLIDRSLYLDKDSQVSLYSLVNDLEKLIAMASDKGVVGVEDIDAAFVSDFNTDIFQLTDALSNFNPSLAIRSFYKLYKNGEDYKIFYMINRHYRNMLNIRLMLDGGLSEFAINQELKISPYEFKKLMAFQRNTSKDLLLRSYLAIYETEVNLKSSLGNFEENILFLINRLANK